ncbi:antibiotic biosynthesis monooxygenase family protein [Nocardia sp. NPDC051570]|uniref:antibiotic biosynthesis monooxygenase family protein n=1 Tax=Nocardia sp. NPDC051570 TaxID=3364324 RepID=UPI00378C3575
MTLIIVLDVKPENCEAPLELIERNTREFISQQPGFVSANLHRDAESTRLVNYAQWESGALYAQARAQAEFIAFSAQVAALTEHIEPIPCRPVFALRR